MTEAASHEKRGGIPRWALYLLIGIGVIMALGLIGGGVAFMATAGAVTAADEFFATDAAQGPAAARAKTSAAFQASTTDASWAAASQAHGLASYKGANWSERSVSGAGAELKGTLQLAAGSALPVTVTLTKGGAGWQVQSVTFANAGVQSASPGAPVTILAADKVAQACRTVLAQKLTLDDVTCGGLAAVKGAQTQCAVTKGQQHGIMLVTIDNIDANGQADLNCDVKPAPATR